MYRFLVPGWSAKPLVSAHDRIMGTHREAADLPIVIDSGDERPRPLVILDNDDEMVGRIRASEHRHLLVLVDAGFEILATPITRDSDETVVSIQVRMQSD